MNKTLFLALSLAAIFTFESQAAQGHGGASVGAGASVGTHGAGVSAGASAGVGSGRYNGGARSYAEGTITNRGADGRLSIRGTQNPYANDYFSYHHDYYNNPSGRADLGLRYRDRFNYSYNDAALNDYSFTVPNYNDTVIYNEPNYGADYTSWNYTNEPTTYKYSDLNVGDRVVIGYDENGNRVNSMYRINPRTGAREATNTSANRATNNGAPLNSTDNNLSGSSNRVQDNTRANDTGKIDNTRSGSNTSNDNSPTGVPGNAGSTNRAPDTSRGVPAR